jgi:hypothetical protein
MAQTKNLGLVKAIFRQSTQPNRTDVLWFDTLESVLKEYDIVTLKWLPHNIQFSGPLVDGAPVTSQIDSIIGLTAVEAGAGFKVTIKDTSGTMLLYTIESDGIDWFYTSLTKAL